MKLGHVALDGTKIKANASKHKARATSAWRSAQRSSRPRSSGGRAQPRLRTREGKT